MASNKNVDFRAIENSGAVIFKKHSFFLNKKSNVFEIKDRKFGAKKTTLFFLTEDEF